ncbi:MAG: hypothetical protein ACK4VO_02985 [Pseudobdellovibrio sp.]
MFVLINRQKFSFMFLMTLFVLLSKVNTVFAAEKISAAEEYVRKHAQIFRPNSPEVLTRLREEVGDDFAQKVMNVFIEQIIMKSKPTHDCSSFIGTCDFYLCQESKNSCGLNGYNLSYGYKYCSLSKFDLLNEMQTTAGRRWVENTFVCLQSESFYDFPISQKFSCEDVKNRSFNVHPNCYKEAGFCSLDSYDKLKILNTIKSEIFSFETFKQGFDLLKSCLKD